jgi:hypothetical protein
VIVSMPGQLLKELLLLQGETDLSQGNLLDAVARSPTRWAAMRARRWARRCRSRCR